MLRRAALALRPSLFVFLASQDAKPKRRRGHQRLFPPLLGASPLPLIPLSSLSHRKNLRNFPATDAAAAPTEHGDNHGR